VEKERCLIKEKNIRASTSSLVLYSTNFGKA
jgi:hypothetical protein